MAEEASFGAGATEKKSSNAPLLVMGALMAVSLAAAVWFWHRSDAPQPAQIDNGGIRSVIHLESFVVNLSGATESAYLRVGIDLGVASDQKDAEKQVAFKGRLRDTILAVLSTRTVDELLTTDGKAKLKDDLLKAIVARVPEIQCREVYFNEFLVQH
jgi:flagellar basal body-associated protein FliL